MLAILERVDLIDLVQECRELGLIESETGVVVGGEGTFEGFILSLHLSECRIDLDGDIGLLGMLHQIAPAAMLGEVEDIRSCIKDCFIYMLLLALSYELSPALDKAVIGILEEYKTQHHVLVLRGLYRAAQFIGRLP